MSDEKLVAGDAVAEHRIEGSAVDKAGEAQIEKVEPTPAAVTAAPVVVAPVVESTPKFEGLRCATCREVKQDSQLMKQPIDYKKDADGNTIPSRFSIFCGICQKFLGIYDPVAAKELNTMLARRNEIGTKK